MTSSRLVLRYIGRTLLGASDEDFPVPREDLDNLPPGEEFEIPTHGIVLGRSIEADIHVYSAYIKHKHVRLWPVEDGIVVEDLASTNGSAVNGVVFSKGGARARAVLHAGDRLSLAGTHDFEIVERSAAG